jgi:hypothetical protein
MQKKEAFMSGKIWLWTMILMFVSISNAMAEPYLAAWEGVNCNACHMNETGGYIRNDFGRNYGNDLKTFDWQGIADTAQAFTHKTPAWITAGVDIHESFGAFFVPGIPVSSSFNPNSPFVPLGRQSFSLAIKANEVISGVFTYRLDINATQEVFALISNLPDDAYFKLGKFTVPYGLELADDNSLIRNDLISGGPFTFINPSIEGFEFGIYPGNLFLNAAVFNDNANQGIMDFSAKGGLNLREFTLGGTIYGQNINSINSTTNAIGKIRYGAYGWTKLGPVVLLGEFDLGHDNNFFAPTNAPGVQPGTFINQNNYTAYHVSAEINLGLDMYLRLVNEYLFDSSQIAAFDGFRDVVTFRFYPVRNLKCQLDVQRMDPTVGSLNYGSGPYYAAVFDTYIFY